MANPNPKHKFSKGNKANPHGRPKLTPEEQAIRKLTKAEVVEITSLILKGDRTELEGLVKAMGTPIFQAMIASVSVKIIKTGDMDALDKLLNRLIGKVKEEVEVSGEGLRPVFLKFEDNGRQAKPK